MDTKEGARGSDELPNFPFSTRLTPTSSKSATASSWCVAVSRCSVLCIFSTRRSCFNNFDPLRRLSCGSSWNTANCHGPASHTRTRTLMNRGERPDVVSHEKSLELLLPGSPASEVPTVTSILSLRAIGECCRKIKRPFLFHLPYSKRSKCKRKKRIFQLPL